MRYANTNTTEWSADRATSQDRRSSFWLVHPQLGGEDGLRAPKPWSCFQVLGAGVTPPLRSLELPRVPWTRGYGRSGCVAGSVDLGGGAIPEAELGGVSGCRRPRCSRTGSCAPNRRLTRNHFTTVGQRLEAPEHTQRLSVGSVDMRVLEATVIDGPGRLVAVLRDTRVRVRYGEDLPALVGPKELQCFEFMGALHPGVA